MRAERCGAVGSGDEGTAFDGTSGDKDGISLTEYCRARLRETRTMRFIALTASYALRRKNLCLRRRPLVKKLWRLLE